MNLVNKIKEFYKIENYVWDNCKKEIFKLNKKVLRILSCIIFVIFCYLTIISAIVDNLNAMTFHLCMGIIVSFIIGAVARRKINIKYIIGILYITYLLIMITAVDIAKYIPEDSITFIIVCVIIYCMSVFDKYYRVALFTVFMVLLYIISISCLNIVEITSFDLINVSTCTLLSIFLGGVLRKLHLENLYLKHKHIIKAKTDQLTKLNNRRALDSIEKEKDSYKKVEALIMIDIDNFKIYNDNYGHQQGDECLVMVSKVFNKYQNRYNIDFFRYGGEEFTGIIWNNENMDALKICQRIIRDIRKLEIKHEKSEYKVVTLSMGLVRQNKKNSIQISKMIEKADKLLYKSKETGRNKVSY